MKNIAIKEIILILCWTGCLISINSNQNDFFYLISNSNNSYLNLFVYYNAIRFIIPFLLFIFFFISFFFIKKKNLFTIFFILYGLWQVIISFISEKNITNLDDYQLILCLIVSLLILNETYQIDKLYKKIFIITLIFINLIGIYFTTFFFLELNENNTISYLYSSKTLAPETQTLFQSTPRVTGFSRLLLLISYYLFFIMYYLKNNLKYIIYIILFLTNIMIYICQSRGAFIGELLIIIYYIILFKDKIIKKIFKIFIIFILPIVFFELTNYFFYHSDKENYHSDKENKNNYSYLSYLQNNNRIMNNQSSSGRLEIWSNCFNIVKEKKIIFGVGPQADRKLLNEYLFKNKGKTFEVYENNSSNALIYSYLSGGIISLSLLLLIYFLTIKELFKSIFINKLYDTKDPVTHFSINTLFFLIIRSIFENSFSLFGIDFCFFSLCYFFLVKKNLKN
jgi:hypothetical protein